MCALDREAPRRKKRPPGGGRDAAEGDLFSELELVSDGAVPLNIAFFEIVEQAATLAHKVEQSVARGVVVGMVLQVLRETLNALGEDRNLHLRGSRVVRSVAEPVYDGLLFFFRNHRAVWYLFRCRVKSVRGARL